MAISTQTTWLFLLFVAVFLSRGMNCSIAINTYQHIVPYPPAEAMFSYKFESELGKIHVTEYKIEFNGAWTRLDADHVLLEDNAEHGVNEWHSCVLSISGPTSGCYSVMLEFVLMDAEMGIIDVVPPPQVLAKQDD